MIKRTMIDTMKKEKFDNLYTPEEAIHPLLKHFPLHLHKIWECADFGESKISKLFRGCGFDVIGSDIEKGFDFLTQEPDFEFDAIVTNPPYSLKDQFLERCYYYGKPFALLLPLTALEGVKRGGMFDENGISVIVLDRRIDFTGKGSNWFNVSWFVHGIFSDSRLIFETVNK